MLPPSAVPWKTSAIGSLGVLLSLAWVLALQPPVMVSLLIMLAACAFPMWFLEYRRHCAAPHTMVPTHPPCPRRRRLRMAGGFVVILLLEISIQIQLQLGGSAVDGLHALHFPLVFITASWATLQAFLPHQKAARLDSVARLALAAWNLIATGTLRRTHRQCVLAWCVKAFFLPLMLTWLYAWLSLLLQGPQFSQGWMSAFMAAMAALYALDTLFGTVGYLSTHRSLGANIRSTDSTALGWASALVCYPPLSALVLRQWLDYSDSIEWTHWLGHSWATVAWGLSILLLTGIYTLATVVFGPRFSNLTHRGIITSGPFRLTKHPAYISKNLSWWLIAVPFVSDQSPTTAALNCAALLGVNSIYWLRAKTEERHLMNDPVYQQYAAWINENGLIAKCRRAARSRAPVG